MMYVFLKMISLIFQTLPRILVLFFGRFLGTIFYYFIPIRKSVAMKNLEIAFPNWNLKKRKLVLHACYRHYGMVLVDFFRLPKIKRKNDTIIVKIPSKSLELFKKNKGGIIMSAHIGNWEYIGPSLGIHNIDCAGVAKIQHNNNSDKFFNELRRASNVKIIPIDAGSNTMIETIKNGSYLGLISDQNAGKRGTEVFFFNGYVSVPKGAGAFHLKTSTPILIGFCILSNDFNYRLVFHELDIKGLPKNSNEAIQEINQRYSKILEKSVQKYPHQYFWFHRKWARINYQGICCRMEKDET